MFPHHKTERSRKVKVRGQLWQWEYGAVCKARNEATGRVIKVGVDVLTGIGWNQMERPQWSQYFKTTPPQIVAWIEKAG